MGRGKLAAIEAGAGGAGGLFTPPEAAFQWSFGGAFASVGQMGSVGFGGISPASSAHDAPAPAKFAPAAAEVGARVVGVSAEVGRAAEEDEEEEEGEGEAGRRRRKGFRLRVKIKNQSLRRLFSGAIAGAVSRTAVAPLETIRTHLMVGSSGHSTAEVFQNIMVNEGWTGLFRGNFVNVIRVAPSKAVEVS